MKISFIVFLIILLIFTLVYILFRGIPTQKYSWKSNVIETELIYIKAEPLWFRKRWFTGSKVLEFKITFSNKIPKKICFYPFLLLVSGFNKSDMGIYSYLPYSSFAKWYLSPKEKRSEIVYVVVNKVNLDAEPNLELYVPSELKYIADIPLYSDISSDDIKKSCEDFPLLY